MALKQYLNNDNDYGFLGKSIEFYKPQKLYKLNQIKFDWCKFEIHEILFSYELSFEVESLRIKKISF